MFCPKCGASNPDEARFCVNCGNELTRPPAPPMPDGEAPAGAAPTQPAPAGMPPQPGGAAAPQPGAAQPGYDAQAPQNPWNGPAPKKGLGKGAVVGIVAGVGVLVLALAALLFFTFCGARGNATPEAVCDQLTEATQRVFDEGMDASATEDYINRYIDLSHPDVVSAMMAYEGYASRDDLAEDISGVSSGLSALGGLMDYVELDLDLYPGPALDEDDLYDINSRLDSLGLDIQADAGYEIDMDITMTLLEDLYGTPAGTTESQTAGDTDASVIRIDGSWYFWSDSWSY